MSARRLRVGAALGLVSLCALGKPARADDKQVCIEAHAQAQRLRHGGKLLEAREQLATCGRPACPGVVSQDCTTWMNEVDAEVPGVVIAARDEHGNDVVAVRVLVDGQVVATRLQGRPIEVDPGEHRFRYELDDGRAIEVPLVIIASEKARPLRVDFPPPRAVRAASVVDEPAPAHGRGIPALGWALGAVGVVGLGVFAGVGLDGYAREMHLSNTCVHSCNPSDVSSVETQYHVADVALGVGVLALGAATWVTLAHVFAKSERAAAASGALSVEAVPLPHGGAATVDVRF